MLKLKIFLFSLSLIVFSNIDARPTTPSSNISSSNITCKTLTLNWTNGNGSGRIIVAKKSSMPSFTPKDSQIYVFNSAFGLSPAVATDEYIVFSGNSNFLKITNLDQGGLYYFVIYEFDNQSVPQYLNSNAPSASYSTKYITLSYKIDTLGNCENNNLFRFSNNSQSNISGIDYTFNIDGKDTSAANPILLSFNKSGIISSYIKHNSSVFDCPNSKSMTFNIIPKKMATFDYAHFTDTVQGFINNSFEIPLKGELMPFPLGVTYTWNDGNGGISYNAKFRKSYTTSGRFHTSVICQANINMKPTSCRDTLYMDLVVGRNPFLSTYISPYWQLEDSNRVYCGIPDDLVDSATWYFGDGDSAKGLLVSHQYANPDTFEVTLIIITTDNQIGYLKESIIIAPKMVQGIRSDAYSKIEIYPNPCSGILNINTSENISDSKIKIFDINGQLVMDLTQWPEDGIIRIKDLKAGQYFMSIYLKNGLIKTGSFSKID